MKILQREITVDRQIYEIPHEVSDIAMVEIKEKEDEWYRLGENDWYFDMAYKNLILLDKPKKSFSLGLKVYCV